jgi:hypothetical protein
LTDQIGVTDVAGVLLNQVNVDPAQTVLLLSVRVGEQIVEFGLCVDLVGIGSFSPIRLDSLGEGGIGPTAGCDCQMI